MTLRNCSLTCALVMFCHGLLGQPQWTAETLKAQTGSRTVYLTRQEYHTRNAFATVSVEECLWKPGYTAK